MSEISESRREMYAVKRAMHLDQPGNVAGKVFEKFWEVSHPGQIEGAAPASIDLTGEENSLRKPEHSDESQDAEGGEGVGRG